MCLVCFSSFRSIRTPKRSPFFLAQDLGRLSSPQLRRQRVDAVMEPKMSAASPVYSLPSSSSSGYSPRELGTPLPVAVMAVRRASSELTPVVSPPPPCTPAQPIFFSIAPALDRNLTVSAAQWAYMALCVAPYEDKDEPLLRAFASDLLGPGHPAIDSIAAYILEGGDLRALLPPPPLRPGYKFALRWDSDGSLRPVHFRQPSF